ncbi:putative origin recognition complex (ORC) subunit 3 N-terminus [Lyophyllum shimeji]|uniref:Origin recognition complex (ORC) subunit 3 N-terminus n=1 Tax=Lyophyllum shimeji TaxID=47721 RepID=A0A9P3UQ54_LYOSH|nr:putative origin recognition complex (ORC) subunit 3 N-terminus [Lyophyllum shimeji]
MTVPNLDDPNQAVFCIPFAGKTDEEEEDSHVPLPRSIHRERDLLDGEKLRIDAYMEAWSKCLDRVKSLIYALHAPIAADIVQEVSTSYDSVLSGLPYPELPVISVTNPTSASTFLDQVTAHTNSSELDNEELFDTTAFTTHLYPTDCVNLTSAMKAMIGGFVARSHILQEVKGRPATSLVNYDIEMLLAWYTAVRDTYDIKDACKPKLVVLLHDFEQLDPLVIQDVFSICSLYVSRLPLVFILALSSPASPSYLHTTYPRSTIALLRVRNYNVPSGAQLLEELVQKTFFDPEFEPDVVIGPSVLTFIKDYHDRHDSSLDAMIKILHLAHLKHFSAEPLTLLVNTTPSADILLERSAFPFIDALFTRLQASGERHDTSSNASGWSEQTLPTLIASVNNARGSFRARARRLRTGFGILKLVQKFMEQQGYKGLGWNLPGGAGILDVMNDVLLGKIGQDVKFLGTMVKKLRGAQLGALLEILHTYFNSLPSRIRSSEEEARTKLVFSINALPHETVDDTSGIASQVAASFGEWLVEYLNGVLAPLEDATLWDIWYTGLSPFPADLINPSVRASIVAGLLEPHKFAEASDEEDNERTSLALWELPDTSILFRRYLDSGKMINLYDWFESFQLELETQRKALKQRLVQRTSGSHSPTKRGRKGKAKAAEEADEEDDLDKWKLEVQARFMRAMQELDYLGFIKHTGRKADHVQRVVYDIHD